MPTYRSSTGTTSLGNVSTFAAVKPTGTVAGDMLLAFQSGNTPIADMALAGGDPWQEAHALGVRKIYWKIAGASEPSTYTVTHDGTDASTGTIIFIVAVQDPVVVAPNVMMTPSGGGNVTTLLTPSLTPNAIGNLDVRWVSFATTSNLAITPPATYTELHDLAIGSPSVFNASIAVKELTSITPTGTQAFTVTTAVTAGRYTIQLVSPDQGFTGWGMPI